jgi:hypothetical protein
LVIVAEAHRAPGEHGVRHRTSTECSDGENSIVEKSWREYLGFDSEPDASGKASLNRPALMETAQFSNRASINKQVARECALTITEVGGGADKKNRAHDYRTWRRGQACSLKRIERRKSETRIGVKR